MALEDGAVAVERARLTGVVARVHIVSCVLRKGDAVRKGIGAVASVLVVRAGCASRGASPSRRKTRSLQVGEHASETDRGCSSTNCCSSPNARGASFLMRRRAKSAS
eukprot:2139484-Pleurochrysis_carterae.AAC.1